MASSPVYLVYGAANNLRRFLDAFERCLLLTETVKAVGGTRSLLEHNAEERIVGEASRGTERG